MNDGIESSKTTARLLETARLAKFAYFLLYCARGALEPYLTVFLVQRGYGVAHVTALMGLVTVVSAVATPVFAYLADRHRCHARMQVGGTLGALLAVALLPSACANVPPTEQPVNGPRPSLLLPGALALAFGLARAPVQPLLDSATMGTLAALHSEKLYGRLRVYGSVGFTAGAFAANMLTDALGPLLPFWWYGAFTLVTAGVTHKMYQLLAGTEAGCGGGGASLPQTQPARAAAFAAHPRDPMLAGTLRIVRANWAVFAVVLLAGMSHAVINTMVPLFLRQTVSAPGFVLAIAFTLAGASEVPVFVLSRAIIGNLGRGVVSAITLSLLCAIARMAFYCFAAYLGDENAPNVAMVFTCAVQVLHGVTFSLFWAACVDLCDAMAPPSLKATFQGILSALYNGAAAALGAFVSGLIFDHHSPNAMFATFAVLNFAALVLHLSTHRAEDAPRSPLPTTERDTTTTPDA